MTRTGKTIAGILVAAIIAFGVAVWTFTSAEKQSIKAIAEANTAESDRPTRRRARTGPRKPPPKQQVSEAEDEAEARGDGSAPPVADHEADADDEDSKLEEYLEHLEALDNPNVDELTTLGELAFDASEAEAAYGHYLEVIEEHTDDPSAPFALYKLAWAEYNLGDVEAAIDDMKLVIEWIEGGQSRLDEVLLKAAPADLEQFQSEFD